MGSFAVRQGALHQVSPANPGANAWLPMVDPLTVIGDATGPSGSWVDYALAATVSFSATAPLSHQAMDATGGPPQPLPAAGSQMTKQVGGHPFAARPGHHRPTPAALRHRGRGSAAAASTATAYPPIVHAHLAPCDQGSGLQAWRFNVTAANYLSNTVPALPSAGGDNATLCLAAYGCGPQVAYCVRDQRRHLLRAG